MNMLSNLTQAEGASGDKDVLGGGSRLVESGVATYNIDIAYLSTSSGGATAINLHLSGDTDLKFTIYMTNRNGETFYVDKKDSKKKHSLPGFNQVNSLAMLATGVPLSQLTEEEKVIKLYDYDAKAELPQTVKTVAELKDKKIMAGIIKQIVDKKEKNDDGVYVATGETREENEVDKFFCAQEGHEGKTITEIEGNVEASFIEAWKEKNTGVTRNKAKGAAAGGAAKPGAPAAAAAPTKSLFAK